MFGLGCRDAVSFAINLESFLLLLLHEHPSSELIIGDTSLGRVMNECSLLCESWSGKLDGFLLFLVEKQPHWHA